MVIIVGGYGHVPPLPYKPRPDNHVSRISSIIHICCLRRCWRARACLRASRRRRCLAVAAAAVVAVAVEALAVAGAAAGSCGRLLVSLGRVRAGRVVVVPAIVSPKANGGVSHVVAIEGRANLPAGRTLRGKRGRSSSVTCCLTLACLCLGRPRRLVRLQVCRRDGL